MARTTISTVKTYFESGDRPSEQDYINLIDTLSAQATDLGTFGNNENTVNGIENESVLDTFETTQWRLIKYIISISKVDGTNNRFYATELSILVDKDNLSVSEYGTIDNDGNMGTISISQSGTTASLVYTPDISIVPVTARYARIGLKA